MTRTTIERPGDGEYLPYYGRYIALVPEGDILETMVRQNESTLALLGSLSEAQGAHRYAPDKWSTTPRSVFAPSPTSSSATRSIT